MLRVVAEREDYEELLQTQPQTLVERMEEEVVELVGRHLNHWEGVSVVTGLKRKVWMRRRDERMRRGKVAGGEEEEEEDSDFEKRLRRLEDRVCGWGSGCWEYE